MRTKIVLWGSNAQDERVLIALSLRPDDNKVDIWTFPESVANEEFYQLIMRDWRNGMEVAFPEEKTHIERELSMTENLLPEDLKIERGEIIQRAQTEWHFVVLSSKLNQVYQNELEELKNKVESLESYDGNLWDSLKEFWSKVQGQVRERNLFRDHADQLRDNTNVLFSKLKELRSRMDDEFRVGSKERLEKFMSSLQEMEDKAEKGLRLQPIFEDLKKLQRTFRDTKLTREHRNQVWNRLDAVFKKVKEKRFGSNAVMDASPAQRIKRRFDGLVNAIQKMEKSIKRDKEDLAFQKRKIEITDGQLEAQIRQAKILMIESRIQSKEEKLKEMQGTKEELEVKLKVQEEKTARREERKRREEAKVAAKQKIAKEIQAAAVARQPDVDKLAKAAEAIVPSEEQAVASPITETEEAPAPEVTPEAPVETVSVDANTAGSEPEESILAAAGTMMSESLTDVMDTVKAVAEVVSDRIEDAVEDLKEDLKEKVETAEEKVEEVIAKMSGNEEEE